MDLSVLRYEVTDQVARVAIHNPPVNALDTRFLEEFEAVLERLSRPGEARAVVLRSDCPGFFSAGDDVRDPRDPIHDLVPEHGEMHAWSCSGGSDVRRCFQSKISKDHDLSNNQLIRINKIKILPRKNS